MHACDEAHRASSTPTSRPPGRRRRGARARGRARRHRGAPRACSSTGTSSTPTADRGRPDRAAHLAEPGRPSRMTWPLRRGPPRPADDELGHRCEQVDPQLRPVHLLRDPLPRPHRGPGVTVGAVIGVGNPFRRDDGLGLEVVRRAADAFPMAFLSWRSTASRRGSWTCGRAPTPPWSSTPCAPMPRPGPCTASRSGRVRGLPAVAAGHEQPRGGPGGGGRSRPGLGPGATTSGRARRRGADVQPGPRAHAGGGGRDRRRRPARPRRGARHEGCGCASVAPVGSFR